MEKKTVLHLPAWYPNATDSQLGVFIEKQINSLSDRYKNEVVYFQFKEGESIKKVVTSQGNTKTTIVYYGGNKLTRKLRLFKAQRDLISSFKFDILHIHCIGNQLWLANKIIRKGKASKVFYSEHWTGYRLGFFEALSTLKKRLFKRIGAAANAVIVVSESLKDDMSPYCKPRKWEVVPNIIDSKKKIGAEGFALVVADFVDDRKRISSIIEAFLSSNPEKLDLVVIGDGKDWTAINDKYKDSRIHFVGRKDNKETLDYMSRANFFIQYSNFETFGMVALESLACGTPIITSPVGYMEVHFNTKMGICVNSFDELTSAIRTMNSDYINYIPEVLQEQVAAFSSNTIGNLIQYSYSKD